MYQFFLSETDTSSSKNTQRRCIVNMPTKRNLTGKQLGDKVHDLFELIEETPNWEKYVSSQTEKVVKTLYRTKVMKNTMEELDMKYTTVRAHLMRARDRIGKKKVDYLRDGESKLSRKLFQLMESDKWRNCLTEHEVLLAEEYRKEKNFHEVARKLDLTPGNIAATLYGNTQKRGVISKIEKQLAN